MAKKVVKSMTLDPALVNKIEIFADYEGRTFSGMVSYILGKYQGNGRFENLERIDKLAN